MRTVHVNLGNRSYDILVGRDLLQKAGPFIANKLKANRVAIVSDENVAPLYLDVLVNDLKRFELDTLPIVVGAGEKSKSFSVLEHVVSRILEAGLERGDVIVALGGGVIGDLAGFASAIVKRGMNFVQIPTSLLAQVDSSVGGKTGINSEFGKNLIGAFYQPRFVIADSGILDTLPLRQFRAGYAELVKYGLINQPVFFEWLEHHHRDVFAGGPARDQAIAQACAFKAAIVNRDEQEQGERALLNLGHTFGHALETATCYDPKRLVHGEAVAIGTVLAYQFSAMLTHCNPAIPKRIEKHFREIGLPTKIQDIPGPVVNVATLMKCIAQDKKNSHGELTFILCRALGQSFIAKNISPVAVKTFLEQKLIEK